MKKESFNLTRWMVIAFLLMHAGLLLAGSYERSADGWIHLFFADHWQQSWWNDWEPRWNEGFSLFSYPPLAHQLLALLGFFFGWPQAAWIGTMGTLVLLLWGIRRLSLCWGAPTEWTVLLAASLSSLAITLHVFGQLTHLFSLALLLHALVFTWRWLIDEDSRTLAPALFLTLASALSNLYAGVFGYLLFGLPILIEATVLRPRETLRRVGLLISFGLPLGLVLMAPALYFYQTYQAVARPVFHSSQSNVLALLPFNWFMFYGHYAAYLLALPGWILTSWKTPLFVRFAPSLGLLGILSLGGATPVARGMLGSLFDYLSLDRFGFWNSLLLTPLFAAWGWQRAGSKTWQALLAGLVLLHLAAGVFSATAPWWRPLPQLRDLGPLVVWLNQPAVQPYRYLTLGLQRPNFAKLSTLVRTPSVDGNFPFGRNQLILNDSGMASLDDARHYGPYGLEVLQRVLQQAPGLHLKYIVVADRFYDSWLRVQGWSQHHELGETSIWTREGIPPLPPDKPMPSPLPLRLLWGVGPLLMLTAGILTAWRACPERATQGIPGRESEAPGVGE